jgi:hypothetical protein
MVHNTSFGNQHDGNQHDGNQHDGNHLLCLPLPKWLGLDFAARIVWV